MSKPSEKAMREPNGYDDEQPITNVTSKWRSEHITWLRNRVARGDITEAYFTACVKQEIDAHAAEALSEHKRVLGLAESALADAQAGLDYVRQHHGDLYGVGFDRCEQNSRLAQAAIAELKNQ